VFFIYFIFSSRYTFIIMSFSRIQSAQLSGLGATGVTVEVDISRGLYLFQIVGLPDKAVEESRERVISALRNSLDINPKSQNEKVIVSLSPAELKKEGAYFDVAIALGYLASTGILKGETTGKIFVGGAISKRRCKTNSRTSLYCKVGKRGRLHRDFYS
jgi:predicted ATPase with chaperone activity